jgi:aminobenzoyl-glutamate transport protein
VARTPSIPCIRTEPDYTPEYEIVEQTIPVESLLTVDGIRFILTSFVGNFASFAVVAVTFVAMMGVGVAEGAGLMAALIRKMVAVAPRGVIAFILIFTGVVRASPPTPAI